MNVTGIFERFIVAAFGGAVAALVVLFLGGFVWFLAMAVPGDAVTIPLTKWLLLYMPVAGGVIFAVCALFAPDKTADYFGSVVQKVYRSLRNGSDAWP